MIWQTNTLLHLHPTDDNYYWFGFFSTICSYNFHWYLTPSDYSASERILWNARNRRLQAFLSIFGAIGAGFFFFRLQPVWLQLFGAAFLTFLYSAPKIPYPPFTWLRRIAIGKTIFLSAVWVYVTTVLPLLFAGQPFSMQVILFTVYRFFLVYALCILFDCRDLESDRKEGIRSLITWLSHPSLMWLYNISLIIAAICALFLYQPGQLRLTIFMLLPVLITALLTKYTLRTRSDYYYYFVLDGLVMLSALLHFIAVVA